MTAEGTTNVSLASGSSRADITTAGATLCALVLDGVAVLDGFAPGEIAPSGAGQVLAPWPNRLADGRYEFGGTRAVVPINELTTLTAIHGLVRWTEWAVVSSADDHVTMSVVIPAQPAYPWRLGLDITYALAADSLTVGFAATNLGVSPAPFGIGFHPYFVAEGGNLDGAVLELSASEHLLLDDRGLPIGTEPVAHSTLGPVATERGLSLSAVSLDDCFTGLGRSGGSGVAATFRPGPRSRPVRLTVGPSFSHLMVFTGDTLRAPRRRRAVAIEPMTCAPNALANGEGREIAGGERVADAFTIAIG